MFKRANKITALLVAAASVMSLVPAMAADTTKRLGTNNGTIENAVAFKDGKYVYEGYKSDDTDKSVYYNAGDKDKDLTDLTDADVISSYSDKYAFANDGSDQYLVDLSNGNVTDDETVEDNADTAATKLKTALKKTDRYGDSIDVVSGNLGYVDENETGVLKGNKFGDVWYQYGVTTSASDAADNLVGTKLYGYTDATGKYIDASNVANIYAYSTAKDKVVKIDEFSNSKTAGVVDDADADTKLQAELLSAPKFLAQDKDSIYQKVSVKIYDTASDATTSGQVASAKVVFPETNADVISNSETPTTYTVDYSTATTGAAVTIAGHAFTAADASTKLNLQTTANAYFTATANKVPGYTYNAATTTFTADTKGTGAPALTFSNITANYTAGLSNTATFTVAGKTFTYYKDAAAITAAGLTADQTARAYTSLSDLKAKVKTYFDYAGNVPTGYTFNDTTYTFTATAMGATPFATEDGTEFTAQIASAKGRTWEATYIQKISKAQGDVKDDAYVPKSVASYELSKNYYDSDDGDDAFDDDTDSTSYQVSNGTLFAIKNTGSNVHVYTMKLMKDKVKFDTTAKPDTHKIDDKVDVYLVEQGDDDDQDVDLTASVSTDVNGNVWAVHDGKIYKFESGEFKEKFTLDSSINSLDVYDDSNLIAWENDGDVYTTVNEGTAVTQGESTAVAPVVVTGWVQGTDGSWTFNDATGAKVVSKWINVGGAWYFLKADGIMATGWYNDNGTWYFLNASGAMATGWYNDNGTWYYLNASGAMLANTTVDGYVLGASGAWIQ